MHQPVIGGNMADQEKKAVRSEILKFGPSPYYPNDEKPYAALFHNEMEQTVGTADTEIFGKPATVFLLVTTFRIILFKYNKRKDDEVYSFWFDVDLSDDPFHDTEGFLVSHIKTAMPEYGFDESLQRPYFTWHYNFYNPENVKKEAAFIKIFPVKYFYHQKQQFIDVLKPISIPGYKWKGEDTYLGIVPFSGKFLVIKHSPMGTLKMVDLMLMHKSPEFASFHDAGSVPEECPFHESKATRPRESIHVKSKAKKGSSKNIKKEEKNKKPAEKKKEDSLKKAAATALDVGSKIKGSWEVFSKAASAVTSSAAGSIKEAAAKTAESAEQAGKSLKQSVEETISKPGKAPLSVCAACGAPMRPGALFCGKCGQKAAEKVVKEVKDQVKGKVEDRVVEKAKEFLEEKKSSEEMTTRDTPIKECGLPKNIVTALENSGIKKMGELADQAAEDINTLSSLKGVGPAAIKQIKKAIKEIPVQVKEKPASQVDEKKSAKQRAVNKCLKCGKELQPDWAFCPYCQHPVRATCPKCGQKIEADWLYCPMCNTKIG